MNVQIFKQSWQLMRENPLVAAVSALSTSLSIAMALVVSLNLQVGLLGYAPMSNKERMLFVLGTEASAIGGNTANRGTMSVEVAKECFYSLKTPEAVTAISSGKKPVSLPSRRMFREYSVNYTDADFWRVFDFSFVGGQPFTEADFESGIPRAVVSVSLAKNIFGPEEAVGRDIIIDNKSYRICGTVKDVSSKAEQPYAQVWLPYSSNSNLLNKAYNDGISGSFRVVMLARSRSDFDAIRNELNQATERYNAGKTVANVDFMDNPATSIELAAGFNGFQPVSLSEFFLGTGLLMLFMLLVPAINLIGFILSSVKKRQGEIGIRKAFGASRRAIIGQVIYENLVTTAIGGFVGIALSFLLFRLYTDYMLTAGMLLKPVFFVAAVVFVLLLNLLSAGIPAVLASRKRIIEAIKDSEE